MINFQQTPPENTYDIWLSFNKHQDGSGHYVRDSELQSSYDLVFKVFFDGEWRPVSGISIDNEFIEQALKKKMNIVDSYTAGHIPVFVNGEDECDQLEDGGDIATLIQNYINGGGTIPISRATTSALGGIKAAVHDAANMADGFVEVKFKFYPTDQSNDDRLYVSVAELVDELNNYLIGGGTFNIPLMGPTTRGGAKAPNVDEAAFSEHKFIPVQIRQVDEKLYLDGEDVLEVLTYILQNVQTEFYEAGLGIDITENVISIDTTDAPKGSFLQCQYDNNSQPYLTWAFPSGGNTYTAGIGLNLSNYQFSLKSASSDEIGGIKANSLTPHQDIAKAYCYKDNEYPDFLVIKYSDIMNGILTGQNAMLQAGKGIEIAHTLETDPWFIRIWGSENSANYGKYLFLNNSGVIQWVNSLGYETLSSEAHNDETSYVVKGIGDEIENPEDYFLNGEGEWVQIEAEAEIDFATTEDCGGILSDTHVIDDANAFKPIQCKFYPTNAYASLQHRLCINARDVIQQINEYNYYNQANQSIVGGVGINVVSAVQTVGGVPHYTTGISLSHGNNDWGKFLKLAANGQSIEWVPLIPLDTTHHADDQDYLVTGIGDLGGKEDQYFLNGLGQWVLVDWYNITNTPTIPAAQIQSDWNQSDTSALDYIKNKPTIPDTPNIIECDYDDSYDLVFNVLNTNSGMSQTEYWVQKNTYFVPDSSDELLVGQITVDDGQGGTITANRDVVINWDSSQDRPLNGEAKIFFHTSSEGKPMLYFSWGLSLIEDYSMHNDNSPAFVNDVVGWQLQNDAYYIVTICRDTIQVQRAKQIAKAQVSDTP